MPSRVPELLTHMSNAQLFLGVLDTLYAEMPMRSGYYLYDDKEKVYDLIQYIRSTGEGVSLPSWISTRLMSRVTETVSTIHKNEVENEYFGLGEEDYFETMRSTREEFDWMVILWQAKAEYEKVFMEWKKISDTIVEMQQPTLTPGNVAIGFSAEHGSNLRQSYLKRPKRGYKRRINETE